MSMVKYKENYVNFGHKNEPKKLTGGPLGPGIPYPGRPASPCVEKQSYKHKGYFTF